MPYFENFSENFRIPTLKDLGFVDVPDISPALLIQGGETEALYHFEKFIEKVCTSWPRLLYTWPKLMSC